MDRGNKDFKRDVLVGRSLLFSQAKFNVMTIIITTYTSHTVSFTHSNLLRYDTMSIGNSSRRFEDFAAYIYRKINAWKQNLNTALSTCIVALYASSALTSREEQIWDYFTFLQRSGNRMLPAVSTLQNSALCPRDVLRVTRYPNKYFC
jgi:hypothetical protein